MNLGKTEYFSAPVFKSNDWDTLNQHFTEDKV